MSQWIHSQGFLKAAVVYGFPSPSLRHLLLYISLPPHSHFSITLSHLSLSLQFVLSETFEDSLFIHLFVSWTLLFLREGLISSKEMMGWPHWQTWKPASLEPSITDNLSYLGRFATVLLVMVIWGAVSEALRFCLRDLGGSMKQDSKSTGATSWKPVFSAGNHLGITETSSCTG